MSKATISWQYKCFSVDKFTKIGRKDDSCLEKKVAICDRRVKHFPLLQKQTLLKTKNFICHEYIKNCVKNLFEASVAFSQPKSFISAHCVYSCFYNHFCILHKDLFFKKLCFICRTGLGYRKVIYFSLPVLTEKAKTLLKWRVGKK